MRIHVDGDGQTSDWGVDYLECGSGPYRWARHPMYTTLFSFFVGLALVSASWLVVLLVLVAIFALYVRIGKEEAMMIEQFGDAYCSEQYFGRSPHHPKT